MAVPYRDNTNSGFLKTVATAMLAARRAVVREYALLLRFPRGSEQFRRRFERLRDDVTAMHEILGAQVRDELGMLDGLVLGIFDDSPLKKSGRCFEGQASHYDHVEKRFIDGYKVACAAMYRCGKFGVIDATLTYTSKLDACKQAFQRLCEHELAPDVFLFDAWYAADELLTAVERMGRVFITRLKSNRVVELDNDRLSLRALAASINHEEYTHVRIDERSFWTLDMTLDLKGRAQQRVLICKDAVFAEPVFLTTNSKNFSTKFVLSLYQKRFAIEMFFKDAKQFLHLESFQCRALEKWQVHLVLVQVVHWCIQRKNSISKTIFPIRNSVEKIASYINKNPLFQKFTDELSTRCQM